MLAIGCLLPVFSNKVHCIMQILTVTVSISGIDPCVPNPCGDNALCLHQEGGYSCKCRDGWMGNNCDEGKTHRASNTLRPRQNGRHFPDDILWIFLNENVWISINISLKFVPRGPINNIPTLVQVMAWRRPGDKPLSGPMMVRLPTHICVTRPRWVNPALTH